MTQPPFARLAMLLAGYGILFCLALILATPAAMATKAGVGPVTNLPLPRFASLKSDRINLREGPSKDHKTIWIYQRSGLPIEITAEFETWRRIRDSEGTEGWDEDRLAKLVSRDSMIGTRLASRPDEIVTGA